jgi:PAS domain S-box-containing protein
MWEIFKNFVSPSQFLPHGHCYLWKTPLVGLHLVSDLLIALAYFLIAAMLIYFVYKRKDMPFLGIFVLFGACIILCATGHLLDIWTLWHPAYWLTGIEQALTALVSCYTALQMVTLLPQFLALQAPERLEAINRQLQQEILERQQTEQTLQSILTGTASVTGEEFFPALVQNLATALNVSSAFVAELGSKPPQSLQTLAFWFGSKAETNFEYNLNGTPCEPVVEQANLCYYPDKVGELFPNAAGLKEMGAVCYLGAPLLDGKKQVIGTLCINNDQPLVNEENAKKIMKVFAARAAAELQRERAEQALRRAYDELEIRVNDSTQGLRQRTAELVQANAVLETQINVRIAAESALRESGIRLRKQQAGLLELAKSKSLYAGNLSAALEAITQLATKILNVERGSVWLYEQDKSCLYCADLYELTPNRHSKGMTLAITDYPHYFQALQTDRVIAARNAHTDPRTREFSACYLTPLSIASMLDVPIHFKGQTVGVICLEHTGTARHWPIEEQNFASYLAYMAALAMESRDRKQAEEVLRQSEATNRALLNAIPDMIFRSRADGTCIDFKPAKDIKTFLPADQFLGKTLQEIFPPNLAQNLRYACDQVLDTGDIQRLEYQLPIDHQLHDYEARIVACGSSEVISIVRDITERKQAELALEESAEREKAIAFVIQRMRQTLEIETIFSATTQELRQALNCERVAVYRFNPDWSGEFVSESVAAGWKLLVQEQTEQSELTQVAVNGSNCIAKTLQSSPKLIQDTYLQETAGGIYKQKNSYTCVPDIYKAGFNKCYLELLERFQARAYIIVPIFCSHQLWGLLATYQNSGPRHWQSAEIKMVVQIGAQLGVAIQQAHLLAQTQQQSLELMKAKVAADTANRAKSEFLANMSHELRTPLNAILGFTQLMNRDSSLNTEHRQSVGIISRSGEHLLELINDILEMSKIEAGRTTLHESEFDLYRLLDNLFELLQIKATDKGLKLSFEYAQDVPQFIKTDESKLRQVLMNLLGNAIKFTQQGCVTLRVEAGEFTASKGMQLRFEVRDTGVGIDEMEFDKLFEAFGQTSSGLKSGAGTGLGLPISQKFVQLMGGNLSLSSTVGVGSVFEFDIQVVPVLGSNLAPTKPATEKIVGLAPDQPTYRLLIVEDKPTNRLFLFKMLTSLGFEVLEAENGEEGIKLWQSWQPHLIWMDMQMPIMDGYEATKRIKATALGQSTVIIALTASAFEEDRQVILDAGCDDFVRKPFREQELLLKISQHLGVQYIYEANNVAHSEQAEVIPDELLGCAFKLSASSLQVMPAHWVQQLYHAASQGSDLLLLQLIEQIPPQHSSLAIALTNLMENFRFDKIMELSQCPVV